MEATEAAGFPTLGQEILWQFGPSSLVHPAGPNCWKPKGGEASVCGAVTPRTRLGLIKAAERACKPVERIIAPELYG